MPHFGELFPSEDDSDPGSDLSSLLCDDTGRLLLDLDGNILTDE